MDRSQLVSLGVGQLTESFPNFNKGNFPYVSVQKNGIDILVTFFHQAFLVLGHEGEIYQVWAYLVSDSVSDSRICRPFAGNEEWPFSGFSDIDYSLRDFYTPDSKEISITDKIYSLLDIDKSTAYPDVRIFIFNDLLDYGVVVTDGYWTGFSLYNKLTGNKKDMGYTDVITAPPENPWQHIE